MKTFHQPSPVLNTFHKYYNSHTFAAPLYLAIHISYSYCWLLKDLWFSDRNFAQPISFKDAVVKFAVMVVAYWSSSFFICRYQNIPSSLVLILFMSSFTFGMMFHFGSDCKKHFTLRLQRGLITDGFFSTTRNPNYLGEILIYLGFSGLSDSVIHFVFLAIICMLYFIRTCDVRMNQ